MKKIIAFLLAMILALALAACSKAPADNSEEPKPGQTETTKEEQKNEDTEKNLTIDTVKAAPETPADEFEYEENDGAVTITGYNGDGGIVVIPEKINGIEVVAIGEKAFANEDSITAVRLADSVREVGDKAFGNCYGMQVLVCGKSVKTLGMYAFNYCKKLAIVELNEGLEIIEPGCFGGVALREIEIPSTVTELASVFNGTEESPVTLIAEAGGYVEQYVAGLSDKWHVEFRAK